MDTLMLRCGMAVRISYVCEGFPLRFSAFLKSHKSTSTLIMSEPEFVGYGSSLSLGSYLRQTREDCITKVQPNTSAELRNNVTACVLNTFTETDKAIFASRQYVLTLWPAFVATIVALAPDPAYMVYDNIWWSILFAVTCGGLPGLDTASPPHHVEAHSEQEGRELCEVWQYNAARPKAMSKTEALGTSNRARGKSYLVLEWLSFAIGVALWLGFCVYFTKTLESAVDYAIFLNASNAQGAVWYYISCSPAVLALIFELLQDRVELYEPENAEEYLLERVRQKAAASTTSAPVFRKFKHRSVFHLWSKIALYQWRRSKYRILVRDSSSHWFFLIGRSAVGLGRVTIFARASTTMGNILLMPVPDDMYLFIILLFTTALPRQLWQGFWTNGNRGADLVVIVNSIRLIGLDAVG